MLLALLVASVVIPVIIPFKYPLKVEVVPAPGIETPLIAAVIPKPICAPRAPTLVVVIPIV